MLTVEDRADMNITLQRSLVRESYIARVSAVLKRIQCFAKNTKALDTKSLRIDVGAVTFGGYTPLQQIETNPE